MPSGRVRLLPRPENIPDGQRLGKVIGWLRRRAAEADKIAWAVAAVGFGLYLTLTLARWHRQEAPSLDLAIFEQAVKGWAHFGWPIVDIKGPGANQLGDHFSPILALLGPFYRLFPSPVTLLVAQCVLVALSIVPITALARRRVGKWSGICLGVAYTLSWGLQTGVDAQFHEYAFAVPMIAFALAAAVDQRWGAAAAWAAATLAVKEDMGLTVMAFGAVMAGHGWWLHRRAAVGRTGADLPERGGARHAGTGAVQTALPAGATAKAAAGRSSREEQWDSDSWATQVRVGLALAGAGLVALILVFGLIMPAFKGGSWYYWDKVDQTSGPLGLIVGILQPAVKLKTLAMVSAVVMGTCWFSRWSLVAAPTLLWRFASTDSAHWGTAWHYSMILMPMVFVAAIDALGRWRARVPEPAADGVVKAGPRRRWRHGIVPVVAVASLVFALVTTAWFPLAGLVKRASYQGSPRAEQAARVLAAIPPGASVASDRGLITQLATDHTVYWIGDYPDQVEPEYVLLDPISGWSGDPGAADRYAESVYGGDYEPVSGIVEPGDASGYRLARRLP
ncbi:MAG: DUF2079 domain-containing protein [Bifidobacteriaceae bacterium]|jgi:uncharacterized membrane protein|nr:DUF2079 domain-containing protein [Bifidobacteriaceae bacterium]